MTKTTEEVKNVNEDGLSATQLRQKDKATRIYKILGEEPADYLHPFLQVTERGILPNVRLEEVPVNEDDNGNKDTESGDEAESGESTEGSEAGPSDKQSTESQDSTG